MMSPGVVQSRLQLSSAANVFLSQFNDRNSVTEVSQPSAKSARSEGASVASDAAAEQQEPGRTEEPQTRRTQWCDKCNHLLTDARAHEGCKYYVVCQACGVKRSSLLHFRLAYEKLMKAAPPPAGNGMVQYVNGSVQSTAGAAIRTSYTCEGCKMKADETESLLGL